MFGVNPYGSGFGQAMGLGAMPQMMPQIQPSQPGLMANTSAFQFLDALMNQPGGFNPEAIPGYGTDMPFGMPMYLPPVQFGRNIAPPAAPPASSRGGPAYNGGAWQLNQAEYGYQDNPPGIRKGSEA